MFFLPLYDDNPAGARPLVVGLLMAVCIAVFVWQVSLPPSEAQAAVLAFGAIPAVLFGKVSLPPEIALVPAWLSVFTSMFLHGGWFKKRGVKLFQKPRSQVFDMEALQSGSLTRAFTHGGHRR